ncbi:MAG: rod shape-determining protein RodA [Gemmatimonadales bacterium]|nr:rod shape-determining protein RodA [Gemmatimonadales bacterium]
MSSMSSIFPLGDRRILWAWVLLCLGSLALLWSVTEPIKGPYEQIDSVVAKGVFYRQVVWMLISYIALFSASRVTLRFLENMAVPLFIISVLLLVYILATGPRIGGARRWLVLGPLHFQASELAKVAFILLMAQILERAKEGGRGFSVTLGTFLLMLVPLTLVLREPDLGTSLVFLALWVGMIFWFGVPGILLLGAGSAMLSAVFSFYSESVIHQALPWAVYLLVLVGALFLARMSILSKVVLLLVNLATGIGIPFFWEKLQRYQQERILTFFDPTRDAFGSGYQAIQSKVAIGSGGLFGSHYLQGTQKGLAFLPERHTDFIFSVAGEELGLVGVFILLGLYLVVILRGIHHGTHARRSFARFLAIGVVTYFSFHVGVNVAITTGLLPVTGLPLPLISYGGSNLLISSILVGLLLNVSSRTFDD